MESMSQKTNVPPTFPTFEEAREVNPNLDQASYGFSLFMNAPKSDEYYRLEKKFERRSVQPLHEIKRIQTWTIRLDCYQLGKLLQHSSPLVRRKALQTTKTFIEELQKLIEAHAQASSEA